MFVWPMVEHSTTALNKATLLEKSMRLQRRPGFVDVVELSIRTLGDAAIPVKDVRNVMLPLQPGGELANHVRPALTIVNCSATMVVPNAGPIISIQSKDLDMQHQP